MKILYIITKANWGGAQKYVYDLATGTQEAGHTVVVAYGEPGALVEKLETTGIRTMRTPSLARDLGFAREFAALRELARVMRAEHPTVVHLNSSKAGALGALAARLARVPRIVFTAHGWPFREERTFLWRAFAFFGSYATALLSHAVIVVSKSDLTAGRRMPFAAYKMHLIYNGIDLHAALGSGDVIRRAFPLGVRILGTVGELTANKNHMALVERAHREPELFVAIVGEGELRGALEAKIKAYGLESRVKLFGFMPAAEVLRGFDTFALPSKKEGLPYALIEARAAGLPLDAARVGGVPEILDAPDLSIFSKQKMLAATLALY